MRTERNMAVDDRARHAPFLPWHAGDWDLARFDLGAEFRGDLVWRAPNKGAKHLERRADENWVVLRFSHRALRWAPAWCRQGERLRISRFGL